MRILVLNYEFPPLGGGAAPVTKNLASNITSRGHQVDLVTMAYGDLPKREEIGKVNVYRVPCIRSKKSMCHPHEMLSFLPTGFLKSRELINKNDYDLVHAHFIIPTGTISYLLSRLYDIPYAITIHGSDVPGYNPDRFTHLHKLTLPIWKKVIDRSNKIISPSKYLSDLLQTHNQGADIEIIPNGFNYEQYNPHREKENRILVTSRLFERKGIQYLLEALSKIGNVEENWDVVIAGDGPYKGHLEKKVQKLDLNEKFKVKFTGWVEGEELLNLLETSRIFVFPSSHENCPVALQEAMASGNAVIASDKSGTVEVIRDAGITVDPEDIDEFSQKIKTIVQNKQLEEKLRERASTRVREEYNWSKITNQYLATFKESR